MVSDRPNPSEPAFFDLNMESMYPSQSARMSYSYNAGPQPRSNESCPDFMAPPAAFVPPIERETFAEDGGQGFTITPSSSRSSTLVETLPDPLHEHFNRESSWQAPPTFPNTYDFVGDSGLENTSRMEQDWLAVAVFNPFNDPPAATIPHPNRSTQSLKCIAGCKVKPFNRKADLERHKKEQHQCPFPKCKDQIFSKEGRSKHISTEHEGSYGYSCGKCKLPGQYSKIYERKDKLKQHFTKMHGKSGKSFGVDHLFKCAHFPCQQNLDGGVYFLSEEDLGFHVRTEHSSPVEHEDNWENGGMVNSNTPQSNSSTSEPSELLGSNYPFAEVYDSGNVQKRGLDSTNESLSKRARPRNFSTVQSSIDSVAAGHRLANTEEGHFITRNDAPVQQPTTPDNTGCMTPVSVTSKAVAEIQFSMFGLLALDGQHDFGDLLEELRNSHISAMFDTRADTILLEGWCSEEKLEEGKRKMKSLIERVRPDNSAHHYRPEAALKRLLKRDTMRRRSARAKQPSISILSPEHDASAIAVWKSFLLPNIENIIDDLKVGATWSTFLVRHLGEDGTYAPVIRFCSSGGQSTITRKTIRKRIAKMCNDHGYQDMEVQFLIGRTHRLVGSHHLDSPSNDEIPFPHYRRPWKRLGMGASIGISNCPHVSASSGGYLLINGEIFMLSVDHFVYPEKECDCEGQDALRVSSPSASHCEDLRNRSEMKIAILKDRIREAAPKKVDLESAKDTIFQGTDARELEHFQTFLKELRGPNSDFELGEVKQMGIHDKVRTSQSGRYTEGGKPVQHRMDWSLIRVDKKRQGKNLHRYGKKAELGLKDFTTEMTRPCGVGELCTGVADFSGGEPVFYIGSTSGLREGRISLTPGKIYGDDGLVTLEWSVIIDNCDMSEKDAFAGDSGAWILNNDHQVIGMLWGWDSDLLLFTPIHDIFADICDGGGDWDHSTTITLPPNKPEAGSGVIRLYHKSKPLTQEPHSPEKISAHTFDFVSDLDKATSSPVMPMSIDVEDPREPSSEHSRSASSTPSLGSSIVSSPSSSMPPSPGRAISAELVKAATIIMSSSKAPTIQSMIWPANIDQRLLRCEEESNPDSSPAVILQPIETC